MLDTVVRTRQGVVRGAMTEGVAVFKGIPYAAPPFGDNRFQPPRPHEPWDGVKPQHLVSRPIRACRAACHGLDPWRRFCKRFECDTDV